MLYSGNAYLDALIVVYIRYAMKKVFMTYRFVLSCLEQGIAHETITHLKLNAALVIIEKGFAFFDKRDYDKKRVAI